MSSYNVNEILIEPFPIASVNILDIQYKNSYDRWSTIPSFEEHSKYKNNCIHESTVLRFNFKSINANKVRIVLEQKYFTNKNNLREFCVGLKNIEINNAIPSNEEAMFNFKLNIPKEYNNPVINNIDIIYNNKSQIDDNMVSIDLFYRDIDNVLHKINGQIPLALPSNEIEAKCKINSSEDILNLSHFEFEITNLT